MSTQKGNSSRTRPQKHKNQTAFKNTLHDTSNRTKIINNLEVADVCSRCKEIIEWKIKYKKYKPLTQQKKCVSCEQRNIKQAYHVMCIGCGIKLGKCTKCCQEKEVVSVTVNKIPFRLDREMRFKLKALPERRRRTFKRYMEKKEKDELTNDELKEDLLNKLEALKVEDKDEDDDFDFDLSEEDLSYSEHEDECN
ncbi:hypothetical protein HHI36_005427 [Cryptolaemus montrouzieri]|uniref:Uncharacterized protein n=1 Tax=Cryptolaemus montrouzieri TaxID=559131 RepID=A0ABD2NUA9_9CUCU